MSEKITKPPIYLDYAATTPLDPKVVEVICKTIAAKELQGNPTSKQHLYGEKAWREIEKARHKVAQLLHAGSEEIIWTSGATESNNLAIKGVATKYRNVGRHIIVMSTAHSSILKPCVYLKQSGFEVTILDPDSNGLLDLTKLQQAIRTDTILISMLHVNNETGIIHDIAAISKLASAKKIIFHVDAAQSVGKIPINLSAMHIDLMSLSAHKVYGPKGIGALYINKRASIELVPLFNGGEHERGLRAGTLPTHQIVGMGEACSIARDKLESDYAHAQTLRTIFFAKLAPVFKINSLLKCAIPNILNISAPSIARADSISLAPELAISTRSACGIFKHDGGSHVLRAMGLDSKTVRSALRISFGRFTTAQEVLEACNILLGSSNRV